ncbi:MAG: phosphoribosyltransferase family protein [Pyrinomonadaceae bacterium]
MIDLIPPPEKVMQILLDAGAYRFGNFASRNDKYSSHFFQVPMAFHFYDNARVLAVGLSRKFRMDKAVSSRLPQVAIVSPTTWGIPVAFSTREALNAEQIYWAEQENGQRQFPLYIKNCNVNACIIVDDIVRSGSTMLETYELIKNLGVDVIGCGAIVRFKDGPKEIGGIEIKSLVEFDSPIYDTFEEWKEAEGNDFPQEIVATF